MKSVVMFGMVGIVLCGFALNGRADGVPATSSANLVLHVDAQDIDGDGIEEGASEDGLGAGNVVTQWVDKVDGLAFTAENAAYNPVYQATGFGVHNRASVYFDGTDKCLRAATNMWRRVDTSGTIVFVLSKPSQAGAAVGVFATASELDGNCYIFFGTSVDDQWYLQLRGPGISANLNGTSNVADSSVHVGILTADGSEWKLYSDGLADPLTATLGSNAGYWFDDMDNEPPDPAHRGNVTLGGMRRTSSTPVVDADMNLAEILVYDAVLSETDRQSVHDYLASRYVTPPPTGTVISIQ